MQKFHKGDLVHVAANLGPSMRHFEADIDAIVIGSYKDQYGGSEENGVSYTLHLKNQGQVSWYYEGQLTLIERGRIDLLTQWQAEEDAEKRMKSDLDWIFQHGEEVATEPHGASLQALADSHGLGSLWGSRGEGITYFTRSTQILAIAAPFLKAHDKAGWLALEFR